MNHPTVAAFANDVGLEGYGEASDSQGSLVVPLVQVDAFQVSEDAGNEFPIANDGQIALVPSNVGPGRVAQKLGSLTPRRARAKDKSSSVTVVKPS